MTKSLLRPVLIVAALLATMLPAQVTWAQGTRGLVPDPITSQELGQMADRLELSAAQRELLDALHQAYLLDYRALRSDEIESLLQTTTDLNPWRLMSIDTKELRDSVRSIGQVLNSVRALDTALFDQLTPNLSEAQTEQLLGVMQMRERQRLRTGATQLIGRGNPAAGVDLGVLYRELDLSPAERDATEPMVIAYEQSLTAAVRRLHQASNRMATDLIKKLDEQQAAGAIDGFVARIGGLFY